MNAMNKNVIFLISIKNPNKPERSAGYDISIESWKRWANRNNCEVFVLTEPLFDLSFMSPIIMRHYVFDLLDNSGIEYNEICMVDADTIVHPDCPNFFELTEGKFCAVHNDGDYDWVIRSIENYEYELEGSLVNLKLEHVWSYFNTGFMITNKEHRPLHDFLLEYYLNNADKIRGLQSKYGVGRDQPLLNYLVRNKNYPVKLLPYFFNMQDLSRKNVLDDRMLFTKIPGVYHFNAMPNGEKEVNYWLEKTFKYLYND